MPSLELFAELFVLGIIVLVFALAYFWKLTRISATEALHKFFEKNLEIDKLLVTALVVGASYGSGAVVDQLAYVFMETETPMNIVAGPIVGLLGVFPRDIRDSFEKSTGPKEAYQLNHFGWMRGTYRTQFERAVAGHAFTEIPKMTYRSQSRRRDDPKFCEEFCKGMNIVPTPPKSNLPATATPASCGTSSATQSSAVAQCCKSCGATLAGQRGTLGKACLEHGTKSKDTEQDCNFLNLWLQHEKSSEGKAASWFKRTNTLYRIARGMMVVSFAALSCTVLVMIFDLVLSWSKEKSRYHFGGLALAFLLMAPCSIACAARASRAWQSSCSWLSIVAWAVPAALFLYDKYRSRSDSGPSGNTGAGLGELAWLSPLSDVLKSHLKLLLTAYLLCFLTYVAMIRAEIDFHADVWFGAIEAAEKTGAKND